MGTSGDTRGAPCAAGSGREVLEHLSADAAALNGGGSECNGAGMDAVAPGMFEDVLALLGPESDALDGHAPGALETTPITSDLDADLLGEFMTLDSAFPEFLTASSTTAPLQPNDSTSTGSSSSGSNTTSPVAIVGRETESCPKGSTPLGVMQDPKEKRRLQVVNSARRHRRRKKNERVSLQNEVGFLEQQLNALRTKLELPRASAAEAEWKELAFVHRHHRYQAEAVNEKLRRALFQQNRFVDNVKALAALSTPCKVDLNMRKFLHTYTHLGRNAASRIRELEAISSSPKLDLAMEVVLTETESMMVSRSPNIAVRPLDLGSQCIGITTLAVHAFDTSSTAKTFQATCDAILREGAVWDGFSLVRSGEKSVETPRTPHHVRYAVSHQLFQSKTTGDEMLVEMRGLSYGRMTGKCGVFVYDYVDEDDLHPLEDDAVKRCTVGGAVVRPEICSDGVERVVCRFICSDINFLRMLQRPKLDIVQFSLASDQEVFESIKVDLAY